MEHYSLPVILLIRLNAGCEMPSQFYLTTKSLRYEEDLRSSPFWIKAHR